MNLDSETSNTDSENDVNEIEAMLYSQIHHSVEWSSNDETVEVINKENVRHAANEEVIVLSSDDECEILDDCGDVSKYNYHGVQKNSADMPNDMDRGTFKSRVKSENTLPAANSTSSLNSSTTCLTSVYIHIDGDGAQMDAEEIDVGSDTEILSVSSMEDFENVRKRKRKCDKVKASPQKRQKTANNLPRHSTDDEDCIIEIPVPVRKGDDWFICDGDRFQKTPNRRKDFHRRNLHIVCHNCRHRGHITKTCPSPMKKIRCYICGDSGHHGDGCFRATCSVCWETGHSSTSCQQRKQIPYKNCNICHVPGHVDENCPDVWRRYHLTTQPGKLVTSTSSLKPRNAISCCNCGQKGHYVQECHGKRMDFFVLPNRQDVVTYQPLHASPNSQITTQYASNNKPVKAFGKFRQWKSNFKQETMQVVSSVKQGFQRHFRFGNNSEPQVKRNRFPSQGTPVNGAAQIQDVQQVTNARQKKKQFWKNKLKRQKFNWQKFKRSEGTNY